MSEIILFISENWIQWLFTLILALLGWLTGTLRKQLKEEQKKNEAIAEGVQALLRESIVTSYNRYSERAYCPIYAKDSVKRAYASYHALGGNDVATNLYHKLLALPEEKET